MLRVMVWCVMMSLWVISAASFFGAAMTGRWMCLFVVASQVQAMWFAVRNEWETRSVDAGWRGVAVPGLYLSGALASPIGEPSFAGELLVAVVVSVSIVFRSYLGRGFTVGGSTWLGLVDRGPYALLRHPLLALDCVLRASIALAFWSRWNLAAAVIFAACMVGVVILEEDFLMLRPEYRAYARRVTWRLLPGLW